MSRQPFEYLKYRIHNIPKGSDLFEDFPDLKKHEEALINYTTEGYNDDVEGKKIWGFKKHWLNKSQANQLIRYLIYLYDPKSDLIRQEPELADRKKKASELAEFKDYAEKWVLDKGFYFLTRVYNNRKFREWNVLQQELEEKSMARWSIIADDGDSKKYMEAHEKKGKLMHQSQEIHKILDAIESELFGEHEDLKAKANELLLTTPEQIAGAYV